LARETALAEEVARPQDGENGFLAVVENTRISTLPVST
jgi:hypothetical protein